MTIKMNAPQVFISYSWKPIQNKLKVINLAERLTRDGVHVILDDWDLKEGQEKFTFMEQMVNNPEVKRVLLVCNKDYAEKANSKKGGVGIESLIVSGDIYDRVDQTKFIPIVFEYDSNNTPYVPTFVKSRIFIDLSDEEAFEENYESLLRNIFDKPSSKRPPIGKMPSHLEEEEPAFLPTAHMVKTIKHSLINEKKNTQRLVKDYLDTFVNSIKEFEIDDDVLTSANFDELISKNIDDYLILRNDFIEFLEVYIKYSISIDMELLHRFFEKVLELVYNTDSNFPSNSIGNIKSDGLRFFSYELFLHFTSVLIEKEEFEVLAYMVYNTYIIHFNKGREVMELSFIEFRQYVEFLNDYKNRQNNPKRVSVTADTIKQRAGADSNFVKLASADLLLYYMSQIKDHEDIWFPETACYRSAQRRMFPRAKSKRFFEKIKVLFNVNTKDELLKKVNVIFESGSSGIDRSFFHVPNIMNGLNIGEMSTLE